MVMFPPIMPTLEENSEDSANVRSIAERIGDCKIRRHSQLKIIRIRALLIKPSKENLEEFYE